MRGDDGLEFSHFLVNLVFRFELVFEFTVDLSQFHQLLLLSNKLATKCPLYERPTQVVQTLLSASVIRLTLLFEISNKLFSHCVAILQHGFEFGEAASGTVLCQILHEINIIIVPIENCERIPSVVRVLLVPCGRGVEH